MSDTVNGQRQGDVDPRGGGDAAAEAADPGSAGSAAGGGGADQGGGAADPGGDDQAHVTKSAKRIAVMGARMAAQQAALERVQREADELRARVSPATALPAIPAELKGAVDAHVAAERGKWEAGEREKAEVARAQGFHRAGEKLAADWHQRCSDLMNMGADPELGMLLIDLGAEGPAVMLALSDDPDGLMRIAEAKGRARAVLLGRYAAALEARGAGGAGGAGGDASPAPAARVEAVSRMPAPIRPVSGRADPKPDPYRMTGQEAVDFYAKEAMEKRRREALPPR